MTKKNKIWLSAGGGLAALVAAAGIALAASDGPHRFMDADVNRDGQVTTAEIQQVAQQRFAAFDVNRNGSLTGAELLMLHEGSGERGGRRGHGGDVPMHDAGPQPPAEAATAQSTPGQQPAPLRQLRYDFNGDGAISLAEFERGMATRYMLMDADRNGTVSAEELKAAPRGRHGGGEGR